MKFMNVQYFDSNEFDSPDSPGSGLNMSLEFVRHLDQVRGMCGFPFKVTSGFRTVEHNKKVGGEENSAHLKGLAADIVANSSNTRLKIVSAAIKYGFTRIGVGDSFIHLDLSSELDQNVMWVYPSGTKRS